ncbi:MAG: lipoprotein [Thermodesulfovibrionales bacterium]
MRRTIAAAVLLLSIGTLSGCIWEHDRGWRGDRDRDGYQDSREHGDRDRWDRGYHDRSGYGDRDRRY